MSNASNILMAVALTRDEARVWTAMNVPGQAPENFHVPSDLRRHHHQRAAQGRDAREVDHDTQAYFEAITASLDGASSILLVGHGHGKANEMVTLMRYWALAHPDVARKVVGAVDSDLESLSDNQVLALAREWYREHREFL